MSDLAACREEESIEALVRRLQPRLKQILARYGVPAQYAEDLIQTTVISTLRSWERMAEPEGWMIRTLVNQRLMYCRRRRHPEAQIDAETAAGSNPQIPSPEDRWVEKSDIERQLAKLPAKCQRLLRLRFFDGFRAAEVAQLLGREVSSIYSLTHRCMKMLSLDEVANGNVKKESRADSQRAFDRAQRYLQAGSGCLLARAEVEAQWASLDRDRQAMKDAARRLDEAILIYRLAGATEQLSRVLISRGMLHFEQGEMLAASADFEAALGQLEGCGDGEQTLAARSNLAHCYCQLGRLDEAWQQWVAATRIAEGLDAQVAIIRLRWLEGRLHHAAGDLARAETLLEATLESLLPQRLWNDGAILGIDLALIYAEQGRRQELRRLVRVLGPILQAREVHRKALSSLLVLFQAVEQDAVSVGLLREIREQSWTSNPKLC